MIACPVCNLHLGAQELLLTHVFHFAAVSVLERSVCIPEPLLLISGSGIGDLSSPLLFIIKNGLLLGLQYNICICLLSHAERTLWISKRNHIPVQCAAANACMQHQLQFALPSQWQDTHNGMLMSHYLHVHRRRQPTMQQNAGTDDECPLAGNYRL